MGDSPPARPPAQEGYSFTSGVLSVFGVLDGAKVFRLKPTRKLSIQIPALYHTPLTTAILSPPQSHTSSLELHACPFTTAHVPLCGCIHATTHRLTPYPVRALPAAASLWTCRSMFQARLWWQEGAALGPHTFCRQQAPRLHLGQRWRQEQLQGRAK